MKRRRFLQLSAMVAAGFAAPLVPRGAAGAAPIEGRFPPLTNLKQRFDAPIRIRSLDVVLLDGRLYVRAVSEEGAVGGMAANERMSHLLSLMKGVVIPFFQGKDARDLEALVDGVYTQSSNYKYAGMPFWNCVAHAELAIWDMLGRLAEAPVGELLGTVVRRKVPVYLSRFNRTNTAQEEVESVRRALESLQADAVKLKIGCRMYNTPQQTRRDREMIDLARTALGPQAAIYVDANSSYTVEEAVAMGRFCEARQVGFFEEPCPWQDYEATKEVADALEMPVAGGEQDSSLAQFQSMIRHRVVDVIQPDVLYNGGLIRCLRVAKMAEEAGTPFTPHSPRTGIDAAPTLHLLSVVPGIGPHQEYREAKEMVGGEVAVPDGPGLGHDLGDRLARAEVV